jgi:TubC N-terminal docking domain
MMKLSPYSQHSQRARILVNELEHLGFELWLDGADIRVWPVGKLTGDMRAEIIELKPELIEHLRTVGEEIIDDPEERAHGDRNSPPAPALSRDDKLRAGLTASKRSYMNGEVLVNHPNNMGAFMRRLREQDERRQAAERGDAPVQGRYVTRFDVFK